MGFLVFTEKYSVEICSVGGTSEIMSCMDFGMISHVQSKQSTPRSQRGPLRQHMSGRSEKFSAESDTWFSSCVGNTAKSCCRCSKPKRREPNTGLEVFQLMIRAATKSRRLIS